MATPIFPLVAALYALCYGIRYTYRIYDLYNLVFLWLAALHSGGLGEIVMFSHQRVRKQSPPAGL